MDRDLDDWENILYYNNSNMFVEFLKVVVSKEIVLFFTPINMEDQRRFSYQQPIGFVKGNFISADQSDFIQTNKYFQFEVPVDVIYLPVVLSDPEKDDV